MSSSALSAYRPSTRWVVLAAVTGTLVGGGLAVADSSTRPAQAQADTHSAEGLVDSLLDDSDFGHLIDDAHARYEAAAWDVQAEREGFAPVVAADEVAEELFAVIDAESDRPNTAYDEWLRDLVAHLAGRDVDEASAACLEFTLTLNDFVDVAALYDGDLVAAHRTQSAILDLGLEYGTVRTDAMLFESESEAARFLDHVADLGSWCGGTVWGDDEQPYLEYNDVALPDLGADHATYDVVIDSGAYSGPAPVKRVSLVQDGNAVVRVAHDTRADAVTDVVVRTAAEKLTDR